MKQVYLFLFMLLWLASSNAQSADFKLPTTAPATASQLLEGGVPGPSPTIRIRCGTGIRTGNEPLFVVDGVLLEGREIKNLDPNDILEIHILKSPAAESLYGYRAFHGVIIISTKKTHYKRFAIKDAKNLLGIPNASIKVMSLSNGNVMHFKADANGRFETDSLKATDYTLVISAVGYKTEEFSLTAVQRAKGEIRLTPVYRELDEITVVAYPSSNCKNIHFVQTYCGGFSCVVKGVAVSERNVQNGTNFTRTAAIKVFPNPAATGGIIHISFQYIKPGQYEILLLNAAGQLFYRYQKQIAKAETEQIQLGNSILPGIYVVQLINENNQLLQSTKLVVR